MCDMALFLRTSLFFFPWHKLRLEIWFMCEAWLVYICDMTRAYVWHDSKFSPLTWLMHVCSMTHLYMWHGSCVSVIWHILVWCDTHSYILHNSWDMTRAHVWSDVTYVCIYLCMYVCMYVCMYICMCVYMYVCICTTICMYVCMCVCMYVCMYLHTYKWIMASYEYACVCVQVTFFGEALPAGAMSRAVAAVMVMCVWERERERERESHKTLWRTVRDGTRGPKHLSHCNTL